MVKPILGYTLLRHMSCCELRCMLCHKVYCMLRHVLLLNVCELGALVKSLKQRGQNQEE